MCILRHPSVCVVAHTGLRSGSSQWFLQAWRACFSCARPRMCNTVLKVLWNLVFLRFNGNKINQSWRNLARKCMLSMYSSLPYLAMINDCGKGKPPKIENWAHLWFCLLSATACTKLDKIWHLSVSYGFAVAFQILPWLVNRVDRGSSQNSHFLVSSPILGNYSSADCWASSIYYQGVAADSKSLCRLGRPLQVSSSLAFRCEKGNLGMQLCLLTYFLNWKL